MKALEIKKDIYWVGALDPSLRVFDIIMYTPFGTTYNSYVVNGSEKIAVFETVKAKYFNQYVERLNSLNIDIKSIDYIIVDHTEPDHAGSVEKLLELSPNAKVVGSTSAIHFLKDIVNRPFEYITVGDGDTLSLGNKTLEFISAPFLHWPDTIYTYIKEDNILITCDSFGSHYCNDKIFNDLNENEEDYMTALKYYFDCIMGPFKPYVLKAIDKIKDLAIDMICTGHGPILRENPWKIVEMYKEWSTEPTPNDKDITICYVSAYGYTEDLAKKISEGIMSQGDFDIHMYDVIKHDMNEILTNIAKSQGVLFGTPTINGDALKPIWDILISLSPIVHGGKLASAFGSFGWSGEGVPNVEDRLRQLRMNTVPSLKVNFKPSQEDLTTAFKFGESFAEKIKEHINKSVKNTPRSNKKRWKCIVCGEIFEGNVPPELCPACGATSEQFIEVTEDVITFHSDKKEKFVIIGNGIAGYNAADAIRKRNKLCDIEIVSSENYLTYYRPSLSDGLFEELNEDTFYLSPKSWYKENNIILTLNSSVTKIVTGDKKIILNNNNKEIYYDKLILANGSSNFVPPIPGTDKKGVFTLRTMKDLESIKIAMKSSKKALIIGGGLLGLEAAYEIKKAGLDVTVIEWAPHLLTRQLDMEGSELLLNAVKSENINVILGDSVTSITNSNSALTNSNSSIFGYNSVKTQNGKELDVDLIIFSIGINPNINIVKDSTIKTQKGIIVSDKMETNLKDIYACGDVAEINNIVYGNWPAAIEMGKTAGANAVGDERHFQNSIFAMSFNAMGIELLSAGVMPKDNYTTLEFKDIENKIYKKLFFVDNKLVCGILIGNISKSVNLISAIENNISYSEVLKQGIL